MSIPLADALQNVELEIGQTYRCEINGRCVEVRVLVGSPEPMLDPWVEFPLPEPRFRLRAKPGRLPLPDAPDIPDDQDNR